MTTIVLDNPDTTFEHRGVTLDLSPGRYRIGDCELRDDGIVDEVAVRYRAAGRRDVRISRRELICVIAMLATEGYSDTDIAKRLYGDASNQDVTIQSIRTRNDIPAGVPAIGGGASSDLLEAA